MPNFTFKKNYLKIKKYLYLHNDIKKEDTMSLKDLKFEEFVELNNISTRKLKFAVMVTKYKNQYVLVQNKKRSSWEIPGGKREHREHINDAAKRELIEETGAKDFKITPITAYAINKNGHVYHGKLFYAEVYEFGEMPDSEVGKVELFNEFPNELTYPLIHHHLINKVEEFLKQSQKN